MSVRVVGEQDVHRLLPMDECIEAMAEVLAELARGGLHNPLRFVVRPSDASTLMGLMPAYRGTGEPTYSLKTVVIAPDNPTRGLDAHQGFVALFDGTTGQNALSQLRAFHAAVGVTGLVVTKLDGSAKGGVLFALAREFGIPIRYVGLGEKREDLRIFDPEAFVDALLPPAPNA